MRTSLKFNQIVPYACITVKEELANKFKQMITGIGKGTITKQNAPQKKGDRFCFEIENMEYHVLLVLATHSEEYHLESYKLLLNEKIRISFVNSVKGKIRFIAIEFLNKKNKWNDLITINGNKKSSNDFIDYVINWHANEITSIDYAEQFSTGLNAAITLAKECYEQFIKNKAI